MMISTWRWLVEEWQWPKAALFTAVVLFALLVPVTEWGGLAAALLFLQLPLYMVHQAEEHLGDRFRVYTNRVIAGGREALSPGATFWINALGVWGVNLGGLFLAAGFSPAAGLVNGYLSLVNGVIHVVQAVVRREYNPGLVTAAGLLIPGGGWCVWQVGRNAETWRHALGLGAAIILHVLIVAHVVRRLRRIRTGTG